MKTFLRLLLPLLVSFSVSAQAATITVLAAASLTNVLPLVTAEFKKTHPDVIVSLSFESSSKLAKQIEEGAPANIFFSADEEWMSVLVKKGLIDGASVESLLGNDLVWVVPADAVAPKSLSGAHPDKLALAGENVPISRYAKAALEAQGEWKRLEPHVVRGDNDRTALHWVAAKQVDAGIVYSTDTKVESKIKVAFTVPLAPQQRLVYPVAPVKRTMNDDTKVFLKFLSSPEARVVFEKAGFKVLRK